MRTGDHHHHSVPEVRDGFPEEGIFLLSRISKNCLKITSEPVNIDLPNETSLFSNLKTKGIYPVVQLCQADRSRASFSPKATQELYHILLPHPQRSSE